jgi:hypothetical protein
MGIVIRSRLARIRSKTVPLKICFCGFEAAPLLDE